MKPAQLSHELRHGQGLFLSHRRRVIGLSLVSVVSMGIISLYQTGIIKHLPEPA